MDKIVSGAGVRQSSPMVDEMFDVNPMDVSTEDSAVPNANLLSELSANDRLTHGDFQKDFQLDFFDDQDLS